jgi:hypothetical protein
MYKVVRSTKAAVRFSLKHSKKYLLSNLYQESLIVLWFSFGGADKRVSYSTGYMVSYGDWDYEKQRIKTNKSRVVNSHIVNNYLNKLETELMNQCSRLIDEGKLITKELIKETLDVISGKTVPIEMVPVDFFKFSEDYLNQKKDRIEKLTYTLYNGSLIKLKKYAKVNKVKVDFNSFTKSFLDNFRVFLEIRENLALNTISKHFKNLRMFVIEAKNQGLISNPPLKYFKISTEETTAIYLNESELQKMLKLDLSYNKKMELARDKFLMGCYTGQRVSDYNEITSDNIVKNDNFECFRIKQRKTKNIVDCIITLEIREIMSRYENQPPPYLHDTDINENIKTVGRILGFNEVIKTEITEGGKLLKRNKLKWEMIETHTGRRSFCTNNYKKGMLSLYIMHLSGHKSEREFLKYIRDRGEDRTKQIVELGYFNV